jgi:hypothetical protein
MRFTLIFRGSLPSNGRPEQKHEIRRFFHPQLKRLWDQEPLLNWSGAPHVTSDVSGHKFRSLVHSEFRFLAELDLLMLRAGAPGALVSAGDIDNRLKTLFDALQAPDTAQEVPRNWMPDEPEKPFFCLLENDRLITRLNVEVAQLLDSPEGAGRNYCELVIRVRVHALSPTYAGQSILS